MTMQWANRESAIDVWTAAIRSCTGDGAVIPVALKLADYFDEATGLSAPTQLRLADVLGMHQEDVSACLRALASQGVIDLVEIDGLPPETAAKLGRRIGFRGKAYRPRLDWAREVLAAQPPRQEQADNVVDLAAWRQARRA